MFFSDDPWVSRSEGLNEDENPPGLVSSLVIRCKFLKVTLSKVSFLNHTDMTETNDQTCQALTFHQNEQKMDCPALLWVMLPPH